MSVEITKHLDYIEAIIKGDKGGNLICFNMGDMVEQLRDIYQIDLKLFSKYNLN